MSFTIVTEDGSVMFREDIFETREEADAFVAIEPVTKGTGKAQLVASTEAAKVIQDEARKARERHARALDIELRQMTARVIHNFDKV